MLINTKCLKIYCDFVVPPAKWKNQLIFTMIDTLALVMRALSQFHFCPDGHPSLASIWREEKEKAVF
jgi:hypothetical protein